MTVTTVQMPEKALVLSREVRELYYEYWKISDEAVDKLRKDTTLNADGKKCVEGAKKLLQEIKEPAMLRSLLEPDPIHPQKLKEMQEGLASIFAAKNNLPEKISDKKDLMLLFGYIEKDLGVKFEIPDIAGGDDWQVIGEKRIMYKKGSDVIFSMIAIPHEMHHLKDICNKELTELYEFYLSLVDKFGNVKSLAEFFSKITGLKQDDMAKQYNWFFGEHSERDTFLFFLDLCRLGAYKLPDEKMRQSLDSLKFYFNRDMRRAYERYCEGGATAAETIFSKSRDDAVRAYLTRTLARIAGPRPQFYADLHKEEDAHFVREYVEGFVYYHILEKEVGEENLRRLEEVCRKSGFALGIDDTGYLVAIDRKNAKMYGIDLKKLKAGETDIENLKNRLS